MTRTGTVGMVALSLNVTVLLVLLAGIAVYFVILVATAPPDPPCPDCGGVLMGCNVRLAPGQKYQGPYYQCDTCDKNFHTEDGVLVG